MSHLAGQMQRFRRPLIGLGSIALVVLALGLIAPMFVDADRFKPEIETKLSAALGHAVRIEEGISFRLLPSPAATVRGIRISAPPGAASPHLASLRKLRAELSLLKLVQGRISFQAILVDELAVTMETLPDGKLNWLARGEPPSPKATTAAPAQTTPATDNSPAIEINQLALNNARVIFRDAASGTERKIDGINLDVEAQSLMGPYKFNGAAQLDGQPIQLAGGLESLRAERASPLDVEFSLPGPGFKARFGGLLSLLSGGYAVRGKLIVEAPSLEGLMRSLGLAQGLAPDPIRLESTLTASANTLSLDEARIEVAGGKGFGRLKVAMGAETRFEARLDMDRLDLDRLTPKAGTSAPGASKAAPAARSEIDKASESLPSAPAQAKPFQLPKAVAGLFDIKVGTIAWNGASAKNLRLDADLAAGELTVSQASVQLPGGGEAAFFGFVNNVPQGVKFEGTLETGAPKLREVLAWMGATPKSVSPGRLQNFRLKASVQGTSAEVRLVNLDATLDETRLLGAAVLKPGPRPALGLALDLNRLDLDSYFASPVGATAQKGETAAPTSDKSGSTMSQAVGAKSAPSMGVLPAIDANFRLTAHNVIWRKATANKILIDGSLLGGVLTFKEAGIGDIAGSALSLKGTVQGLDKGIPELRKLALGISSRQPSALAALAGISGQGLDGLGPVSAQLMLDGGIEGLDIALSADAQGGQLRLDGKTSHLISLEPRFEGRAEIKHPNLAQLLNQPGNWGPLHAVSPLSADPSRIELKDLQLKFGKGSASGSVQALLSGARPLITARLSGDDIDLDAYLPRKSAALDTSGRYGLPRHSSQAFQTVALASSGGHWSQTPLNLDGLKSVDAKADLSLTGLRVSGVRLAKPVAALDLKDGVLTLQKLTATLWGGALDAQARLIAGSQTQIESKATLAGADLKSTLSDLSGLSQAAGKYDARFSMAASGRSQAELVAHLNGDGGFAARDGVVEGIDLPSINRQLANINNVAALAGLAASVSGGGKTAFSQMSASFKAVNGVVTSNDIKLVADGGTGSGTMQADLPQWTQDARLTFRLSGTTNGPALGMRLQGPLDQPRKFVDINDLQRWAVERGLTKGLKVKGLEGLLGGGTAQPTPQTGDPASPSADPSTPPIKEKPSKILKNLLKGL
ncbi:MAG: AsmA family protein [Alphaproteobacteria bacterium]|nr:AsmA family protein [Alphaproteobacteria bacterium]